MTFAKKNVPSDIHSVAKSSLRLRALAAVFLIASGAWLVTASGTPPKLPTEPRVTPPQRQMPVALYPRDVEVALALSAAPEHLRQEAAVYVLEEHGFVKVRDSRNGFACIVNRDHPRNQKPTCYDAEGVATILPKDLDVGEMLMQGKSLETINKTVAEGFRTGKYIAPRRPGVAYMLSNGNLDYNPQTGGTDLFPPHIMFYAPNLTNKDIGSKGDFANGLPSIAYRGPHGFMIVVAGEHAHPAGH